MKMTEFQLNKKYQQIWDKNFYIEVLDSGEIVDQNGKRFSPGIGQLWSDKWQEYKEPVDYGTRENPKLFLVNTSLYTAFDVPPRWVEGYVIDGGTLWCFNGTGNEHVTCEAAILKVIDLPSKEL